MSPETHTALTLMPFKVSDEVCAILSHADVLQALQDAKWEAVPRSTYLGCVIESETVIKSAVRLQCFLF